MLCEEFSFSVKMIISRGYYSFKLLQKSRKLLKPSFNDVFNRAHGKWTYRDQKMELGPQYYKKLEYLGAIVWGWILYHLINDPDMILGEFSSPDPALWTNEELGIPPDDEDSYNTDG